MRSYKGTFWYSLLVTLLLLLPLMGAVLFFASQRQNQQQLRQAAAARGGVAVQQGAQQTHRLLLAVQAEEPGFLLLRVDGPGRTLQFCGLPGSLWVSAPAGRTTLAECMAAAGPGRVLQLLTGTAATAETSLPAAHYLAATPATWAACIGEQTTARIGLGSEIVTLTGADAPAFVAGHGAEPALRTAVWEAFARQNPDALRNVPDALRRYSARTLTSLRTQELTALADTLNVLADSPTMTVDYEIAETVPDGGGRALTGEGLRQVLSVLG